MNSIEKEGCVTKEKGCPIGRYRKSTSLDHALETS